MPAAIAPDRVAVYIRWSTEDQGQGHTLEIQRESCRYFCLSQGWAVRDDLTFIDDGYSGSSLERPALSRLRRAVREGQVQCVVVYKLDRLSRNIKDIINLVLDEWDERCAVRSTQEPVETSSDAGRMFFTMLGSFADFERSTIRTRTWSGKRKSAEKGRNPGMVYPFGFCRAEGGGWAVQEAEAPVVRRIFADYLRGRSCRTLAAELNVDGLRTRSGRMWQDADISRILRNPLYAGRLVYNRRDYAGRRKHGRIRERPEEEVVRVDGAAPALVSPEIWDQAERLRQSRPRVGRGASARTHGSPFLLSGLLRCPCGRSWVGIRGGRQGERYYTCAGARTSGPARCHSRSVKAESLESFVVDRIRRTWPLKGAFRHELLDGLSARLAEQQEFARQVRQRCSALNSALERFKADYKEGRLTGEVYMELTAETRHELSELSDRLKRHQSEEREIAGVQIDLRQAEHWHQRLDAWDALELPEQKRLLQLLVSRIHLHRPRGAGEADLHVEWRLPKEAALGK